MHYNTAPMGQVADFMERRVKKVCHETNIFDVAMDFMHLPYKILPVVDAHDKLIGVINRRNVLQAITDLSQAIKPSDRPLKRNMYSHNY